MSLKAAGIQHQKARLTIVMQVQKWIKIRIMPMITEAPTVWDWEELAKMCNFRIIDRKPGMSKQTSYGKIYHPDIRICHPDVRTHPRLPRGCDFTCRWVFTVHIDDKKCVRTDAHWTRVMRTRLSVHGDARLEGDS
jgi:hypothetical protein